MEGEQPRQQRCSICGSRFAEKKCYFCERQVCTSCIVPLDVSGDSSTAKCLTCHRAKVNKVGAVTLLRRNAWIIGILFGFWIFTIFPIPFLQLAGLEVDPTAFQPVLIASALMVIPFVFMFIAWQRRAPRGSG
ncbi:MAG TPA: hypothetical protein VJ742_02440 [Nitrososphaera sp.]|jgi:hypothetical protein|nr:hypothetical protein [Nitrososphaera sp.]